MSSSMLWVVSRARTRSRVFPRCCSTTFPDLVDQVLFSRRLYSRSLVFLGKLLEFRRRFGHEILFRRTFQRFLAYAKDERIVPVRPGIIGIRLCEGSDAEVGPVEHQNFALPAPGIAEFQDIGDENMKGLTEVRIRLGR